MVNAPYGKFHHVGAIVKDIEKTIAQLTAIGLKPGPTPSGKTIAEAQFEGEFKGKPAKWGVKMSMLKMGDLDIELLQPTGGESVLQEFIDNGNEGVHHVAYIVEDVEKETAALLQQGAKIVTSGRAPRGSFVYLESGGGVIFELRS